MSGFALKKAQVLVIILISSTCCVAEILTLEQRVQQLEKNDVDIKKELEGKVKNLEEKVIRLEEKVQQQELRILKLVDQQTKVKSLSKNVEINGNDLKKVFHRTCHEARAANSSLVSGMYWIDPDGQGVGDDPIYVHCNMTTGTTSILHDSELEMNVGHCADRGCYSRKINYYASIRQTGALSTLSAECHQSLKYDCISAPLHLHYGPAFSWWNDRDGNPQYFWSGSNASAHTCQCGIDRNCAESFMMCNCDSALPKKLSDNGVITNASLLPVTRLNFGRTQLESSSGVHTLGRFECSGQKTASGMPKSCADLWRIGHSHPGLYLVMGSTQVESLYCDFTKLPADSGFQIRIGYVDVKSSPVYFYVQTRNSFSTQHVPIPFDVARLNAGKAMDLASGIFTVPRPGTYFFSFFGISNWSGSDIQICLCINGKFIGQGYSLSKLDTLAFQSTLRLNAGDKVSVQIRYGLGGLHEHDTGSRYTHFTGWLLEEDLSS